MSNEYFTIPNLISIARIIAIPFVVLAMLRGEWATALTLFVLAGVSDGIDGYIARNFQQRSPLGAY
ncbi:MAG: CDP-alcohol phosphatidyltransferase family protein, partial [Oricola sp.]